MSSLGKKVLNYHSSLFPLIHKSELVGNVATWQINNKIEKNFIATKKQNSLIGFKVLPKNRNL